MTENSRKCVKGKGVLTRSKGIKCICFNVITKEYSIWTGKMSGKYEFISCLNQNPH